MGLLSNALRRKQTTWTPAIAGHGGIVVGGNSTMTQSSSGEMVTEQTALTVPGVFACVRVIGEDIAKLPLVLKRRVETEYGTGYEPAEDHPAYSILLDYANDELNAFEAKQAMAISAALWGNGYAQIIKTRGQTLAGYRPLPPWRVKVERVAGRLRYTYNPYIAGQPKIYMSQDEILHIKGPTVDGLIGWMIAGLGAEAIGVAQAAAKFTGTFFSNGASLKGIVTIPQTMGKEEFTEFVSRFREEYEGAQNQNKTAVFDSGAVYNQIGSTPKDAQMVDTLRYSLEDLSRLFRVHPSKLYDRSRAQGWSTLEILNLDHLVDSLMPWFCRIEQEFKRKLLAERERSQYRLEHEYDYLMVADAATRASYYNSALNGGWMSRNEVRKEIGRNPIPGGDEYRVQMNTAATGGSAEQATAEDNQDEENSQVVAESFEHAMKRIIDREANAILAKSKKPGQLEEWVDQWYEGHRVAMITELLVPARMLARLNRANPYKAIKSVTEYADRHCQTSKQQVLSASDPAAIAYEWKADRAAGAAYELNTEVHNATTS